MNTLSELMRARRSVYDIGTNTKHTAESVAEALRGVVGGEKNNQAWDLIHDAQKKALSADMYERFAPRMKAAQKGVGTVFLFESRDVVENMGLSPARAQVYKEHNHGIATLTAWLLLTEMGLGASLQHFNIGYEHGHDATVRELLGLPDDFEMMAQMPFGSIKTPGAKKPSIAADQQVIIA